MNLLKLNIVDFDLAAVLGRRLAQVSKGALTTYGHLARSLGDVQASRWVGQFMVNHEHGPKCACHRVVCADGRLGKYITGDVGEKRCRLELEGHRVRGERVPMFATCLTNLSGDAPLTRLSKWQQRLAEQRELSCANSIRTVAGVDLSYQEDRAIGAYVEVDLDSGQVTYERDVCRRIGFPYIPTYLAFRELPVLMSLLDAVKRDRSPADVMIVDGSGIMHPRRGGIATLFGVAANIATIGVTKKRLVGPLLNKELRLMDPQLVFDDVTGETLGYVMRASATSSKPIYISPGNRMTADSALELVKRTLHGRRFPEPIYWADRVSRRAVSQLKGAESFMP